MSRHAMGRILIGTSGYSYADWVGPFYPPGTRQADFLAFYCSQFDLTELNFTYYRQPEASSLQRMAAVAGDHFLFSVKAHKTLTHETQVAFHGEVATFLRGIEPLRETGKLGVVLLQFPYSFHYTSNNRRYLERLCGELSLPLAIEFRNSEWQRDSVYAGLRQRNIATVNVDEPQLHKLPTPSSVVTSDIAYVRFHGRNEQAWWSGDNVSRYDYLYEDDELNEWIPRITELAEKAGTVLIVFNNHSRGQAVQNARRIRELILERTNTTEDRT